MQTRHGGSARATISRAFTACANEISQFVRPAVAFLAQPLHPPEWTTRNLVHTAFSLSACGQRRILCEWGSETHTDRYIYFPAAEVFPRGCSLPGCVRVKCSLRSRAASVRGHKSEQVSVCITYPTITASLPFWRNRALCTRGQGLNL